MGGGHHRIAAGCRVEHDVAGVGDRLDQTGLEVHGFRLQLRPVLYSRLDAGVTSEGGHYEYLVHSLVLGIDGLGCGVVMAYAMSQRYNDDIILWAAIPLLLLLTVGLVLMVRRNGGADR